MRANLSKWWHTIKIAWSNQTAYRLNFFLQVIGPALVFFFIKYNLWSAIFAGDRAQVIQGYNFSQMINYHVWALIVGLLGQGHTAMNLSEDIRMGRISTYLIYPFDFWEFHSASFIAFQLLQTIICLFSIAALYFLGIVEFHGYLPFFQGFFYTVYVSVFWFSLQFLTGILAFWLEETWILRVLLMLITAFFSGAIIPLDFFPPLLVKFLYFTPFPYLTYYPIKVFLGSFTDLLTPYFTLSIWTVVIIWLNSLLWKKGMKLYTAAGM